MKNVVVLIWDAARLDIVSEYASTFQSLASENCSFSNAIAPSRWSFPSHASILSGKYPHEHGCCTKHDTISRLDEVEKLRDMGYTTYAISGNPFLSPKYGFDEYFDRMWETYNYRSENGLDTRETDESKISIVREAIEHEHTSSSFYNIFRAFLRSFDDKTGLLNNIPHPYFDFSYHGPYSGDRNTSLIQDIINQRGSDDQPFFIVSNYMESHWPYTPENKYLENSYDLSLIEQINDEVGHPWEFVTNFREGRISEKQLEILRDLYIGEIKSADDHLKRIIQSLKQHGQYEDTIVIVTSDHGENLGETDSRGLKRMGHEESVSDNLLKIPLLVVNPSLSDKTFHEYYNIKNILKLITETGGNPNLSQICKIVGNSPNPVVESPADMSQKKYQEYPEIPSEIIDRVSKEHTVVAYSEPDWKLALWSDHTRAWKSGNNVSAEDVPDPILNTGKQHMSKLSKKCPVEEQTDINKDLKNQLEDLGYV